LLAGKLAEFGPEKVLLDVGSGKGFPSLLWSSTFGIQVVGFDFNDEFVRKANAQAELFHLSHRVKFTCRDVRKLKTRRKYNVVACLGIGLAEVYGSIMASLETFKQMLKPDGFLVLAEPVWLLQPVPKRVQSDLGVSEERLRTETEMNYMLEDCGYKLIRSFVSTKEDWEFYFGPICVATQEITRNQPELSDDSQAFRKGFQAWSEAAGIYWEMCLWVTRI
jgi:2-polyprenyl-3-methyl-5-hydroxy-6-metoxy-1,4-benzoquinol methylase